MKHLGDYDLSTVVYGKFTTYDPATGQPATLSGGSGPGLSVYKDNSTTQSSTGVTLTTDFDGIAGLNHFAIDTSADGSFYSTGSFFDVVINNGTVGSILVVGAAVASFTLRKDSALKPTTAARTLDVSATGEAGLDWANIGSPTTAVNLSATNIDVDQVVASVSGAVGSVTGAVGSVTGNVGGNVTGSVGSVTGNVGGNVTGSVGTVNAFAADSITSAALAASAVTEIQTGLATSADLSVVAGYIDTEIADIQARLPAALVGGRMDASVGAMAANVMTAAAAAADLTTELQAGLATAAAVDDLPTVAEFNARTLAAASYATAASLTTVEGKVDTVDTVVDAVKAKTDSLTFTVAGRVDSNITHVIADPVQTNGSTATNWGGTP